MQPLRILFVALMLVSMMLVGQSQSALAMPPEFSFVELEVIFPIVGCDFPIQAELIAPLKVSVHLDQNGDFKMLIERVLRGAHSTYTNMETGVSISSSISNGIDKILIEEDGTVTFIAMGIFDILPLPGQGLVVHDVGRIIVDTTTGELLFSAGQFTVHGPGGSVDALCAALD